MLRYTLTRILLFIPSLFVISLLGFLISYYHPENAAESLQMPGAYQNFSSNTLRQQELENRKLIAAHNLDKPVFYCSFAALSEPDTLYKLYPQSHRDAVSRLNHETGDWRPVHDYLVALAELKLVHGTDVLPDSLRVASGEMLRLILVLYEKGTKDEIAKYMDELGKLFVQYGGFDLQKQKYLNLKEAWRKVENTSKTWKNLVPKFIWYGFENQYHLWAKAILTDFDFGKSVQKNRSVNELIKGRLFWTASLSLLSIIFAYLVSIPLGVWAALKKGKRVDKFTALVLFALDAIPAFWMATLLRIFLTDPDFWALFPPSFLNFSNPVDTKHPIFLLFSNFHFWVLPLFAYTYTMLATMNRIMRASLLEEMHKPYMMTAKAKGLSKLQAVYRHALPNALLPMITIFGGVFPAMVSGSVILEKIFNIHGLGLAALHAADSNDVYVIVAIFVLTGFMTMVGYLVSDILYAWFFPKIRFGQR